MSSNVFNLLPQITPGQAQIFLGSVSVKQPAPQSFADPLHVELSVWSDQDYFTVTNWPACHGSQLPKCGADVLLVRDDQRNVRCVWWDGTTGFPASAGVGGQYGTGASAATAGAYGVSQFVFPPSLPPAGPAGGDLVGTFPNPSIAPLTSADWVVPVFTNSWTNFGGGNSTLAYLKDPLGFVHLKGHVTGGASGTSIFTLPTGYRPLQNLILSFGIDASGVGEFLSVTSAGLVVPTFAGGGTEDLGLDGITFLAEQ